MGEQRVSDEDFEALVEESRRALAAREQQPPVTLAPEYQPTYQESYRSTNQPTRRESNPSATATRGRYPWTQWCDGKWHVAQRGEDFDCSVVEFQNRLHNAGRRKDLWCHSKAISDGTVEFAFFRTKEERERAKVGWGDDPI